ncbi:6382_t:CDS:2 [Gigaspora rosea]|nr:6382_t:CDS:2 [Gigaspora rosea]
MTENRPRNNNNSNSGHNDLYPNNNYNFVSLKLNIDKDKSSFLKLELQFLGHVVGCDGFHPDEGKSTRSRISPPHERMSAS